MRLPQMQLAKPRIQHHFSCPMTKKKLYVLEVLYQAYVWAKDEDEAQRFDQDIQHETPEVWAQEVISSPNPLGWEPECLVYHMGTEDVRLSDVLATPKPS